MAIYNSGMDEKVKKLLAYSSATTLFLTLTDHAEAQIMFTDVDPDIVVEAPGGIYELDLNNDAVTDFIFSATSAGATILTSLGANVFYGTHAVFADPQYINSIAAQAGAASGFAYPYALESAAVVGPSLIFQDAAFQTLGYNFYALQGADYTTIHAYGNWLGGKTDKFVGLKFVTGGFLHYGWLRMDTDSANRSFTIKSYAYEATANTPVTTSLVITGTDEHVRPGTFNVYAFHSTLYVSTQHVNGDEPSIEVFDGGGRKVYTAGLQSGSTQISLDHLPAALYIVRINSADKIFTKKIEIIK